MTSREYCASFLLLPLLVVITSIIVVVIIVIFGVCGPDDVVVFVRERGRGSLQTKEGVSVVVEARETGESLDEGLLDQGPVVWRYGGEGEVVETGEEGGVGRVEAGAGGVGPVGHHGSHQTTGLSDPLSLLLLLLLRVLLQVLLSLSCARR